MTMTNWTTAIAAPVIALILAVSPVRADQHLAASSKFVQDLADRAIVTLTADGQSAEMRRGQFRELFREGFAIKGIARYSLGRNWNSASDADRSEYLTLFEDVIVATWADRFSGYSGQKFTVENAVDASSANAAEHVAIIRSVFFSDPQSPISIDWRVASRGDLFKITDVVIEGVSMANTQRDEFSSVIASNSGQIDALLDILRKKRDG
ncbi:MAG: ABC transporter substrate-binding protein [Alphaproteobacteria bacterium]|nr:ABC transporter substrate-binding protein [Alphaproteobacteria bacterium]